MSTFLSKIQWEKYSKKHLGILFVIGILLVIISMPTTSTETEDEIDEGVETAIVGNEITVEENSNSDYKTQMEEQLTQLLSQVEGVGEVHVMITLKTTTERVVEKDVTTQENSTEESTIYVEGEEGQEPYVAWEEYPTIEGVVVTATGGDNSIIVQNITEAVQALFDVDTHKIKVMKMKSES